MTVVAELAVNAVVETTGVSQGVREFRSEMGSLRSFVGGTAGAIAGATVAAVAVSTRAIEQLVGQEGALAETLLLSSQRLGTTVEQLSRYQFAAKMAADLTGDGYPELVTGKRLFAHNGHDPGGREVLGLYWYETARSGTEWVRHIIHYGGRVGGGMQIPVVDVDGDGDLDIAVAGKGGVFLFENLTK